MRPTTLTFAVWLLAVAGIFQSDAAAAGELPLKREPIIDHMVPDRAELAPIRERFIANQVFERLRDFLKAFPRAGEIGFRLAECEGEAEAWYEPKVDIVTVCYEYMEEVLGDAPAAPTADGVRPDDAIQGPLLEVLLHETAHALFHHYKVPILGREEDAADQFAAYIMLQMDDEVARRMIGGVAHMYAGDAKRERRSHRGLADEHGLPIQRLFNLVCMAYGAKPAMFGSLRERTQLPKERAHSCADEYKQVAFAMEALLLSQADKAEWQRISEGLKQWRPQSWTGAGSPIITGATSASGAR